MSTDGQRMHRFEVIYQDTQKSCYKWEEEQNISGYCYCWFDKGWPPKILEVGLEFLSLVCLSMFTALICKKRVLVHKHYVLTPIGKQLAWTQVARSWIFNWHWDNINWNRVEASKQSSYVEMAIAQSFQRKSCTSSFLSIKS